MLTAPNMDPPASNPQNTALVFLNQKKVETNDAQTTRRPPMVHLDPDD